MMKYDTSRLTPRMVRCLERADEYADSYGHNYTGAEHVVLSILADGEAVPTSIANKTGALSVLLYELHNYLQTGRVRDDVFKLAQVPGREPVEDEQVTVHTFAPPPST